MAIESNRQLLHYRLVEKTGEGVRAVIACLLLSWFPFSLAEAGFASRSCQSDPSRLEARSKELEAIVAADQADRQDWAGKTPEEMQEVVQRDVARRKRVGEIFGEGCFSKAEDYAAAALVYQHGDIPDHFLQAFMWAKRAVELGDDGQRRLMAIAIDRYLVNIGHKQLFASQASKPEMKPGTCWCHQPIEPSFPDDLRKEIGGQSLKEAFGWLEELNQGTDCPNVECAQPLEPSPAGTIPGFW